jgi:uncharacterized membrane protein YfhO
VTFGTSSPSEFLLATSLPAVDGWTATASGETLAVRRINHAFVGVDVVPGEQEVVLRYTPPGFRLGALLSIGSAGVLAAGCWLGGQRRKRSLSDHQESRARQNRL